ncbi:MAG: response regulator [Myxococcota bacterium]
MVVDDSPADRLLMRAAFARLGQPVPLIEAEGGTSALALLEEQAKHGRLPSVVLLDIRMPDIDGLEVLQRLRDDPQTRLLPVVILSTSGHPTDVRRAFELGSNAYAVKPDTLAELDETLSSILSVFSQHSPYTVTQA